MSITSAAVYFSPTGGTRTICTYVAEKITDTTPQLCDLTDVDDAAAPNADVTVFAVPVFGGRVPQLAYNRLNAMDGTGKKAVALAVYGNRHYDDALLELCELLNDRGFTLVAAGAFIARHSIIPEIASDRPNASDYADMDKLAEQVRQRMSDPNADMLDIHTVYGNHPFKEKKPGNYPIVVSNACTGCTICANLCPVAAISFDDVTSTDKEKCFGCMRCINVCPVKARSLAPERYEFLNTFLHRFETPRANEMFL